MKRTVFVSGAEPDSSVLKAMSNSINEPQPVAIKIRHSLNIDGLAERDKTIAKNSQHLVLGLHERIKLDRRQPFNLFNLVANPDDQNSQLYLAGIQDILNKANVARVFNHPDAVNKTGRLNAQHLFANIDGVINPRIKQISCANRKQLIAELQQRKINPPVIIRDIGTHNGVGMRLVENFEDINLIEDSFFNSSEKKLCIDFLAEPDDHGIFHKCRIAVVNGQLFPRHKIFSDHWCVHSSDRERLMLDNEELRREEKTFIHGFLSGLSRKQKHALEEMDRRIALDIWGMDFAINHRGEFIVFEANACMNFFGQNPGPNREFEYLLPYAEAIRKAIKKLILHGN